MYYGFVFHFIIGLLVFSNDRILSSSDKEDFKKEDDSIYNLSRYTKFHVVLFIVGNIFLLLVSVLKTSLFTFLVSNSSWLNDLQHQYDEMDAISDDYYQEIHFKFLMQEYERTKHERQNYLKYQSELRKERLDP